MVVLNHHVKAAVSFNNYAVALLSKGFIPEAVDTLKDCLKILSIVSETQVKNLTGERILEVQNFLESAHHLTQKRFVLALMHPSKLPHWL
jgi:hypothetical protein